MSDADGATLYASHSPGRPRAEFLEVQRQRADALTAAGDTAGAAEALARARTQGAWSVPARDEQRRTANQYGDGSS